MKARQQQLGLRGYDFAGRYRSNLGDVVHGFYVPCFERSSSYSRAVGYFTSTSLALYARGLEAFAARGGTMRLIASPNLVAEDIDDIDNGYEARSVIERAAERELSGANTDVVLDGLGLLGRLIAGGQLDIKLAFVERNGRLGIYHEKIGVFRDDDGDLIGFTGSSNETLGGLAANFESVQVYRGWVDGDGARALEIEADFEMLWSNETPGLRVEPFPAVARDRLVKLGRERSGSVPSDDELGPPRAKMLDRNARLEIPDGIQVRSYQRAAVDAWFRQRGRGILKMATGTGKTKTALIAATKLADIYQGKDEPFVVVVVAPLQHLVDQWVAELDEFGVRPVPVYEQSQRWQPLVEEQLAELNLGRRRVAVMVATNASFSGAKFQSVLSRLALPLLFIADEAHNLGSDTMRARLPESATYRLALSATPERWHDDEGTDALTGYFGPVAYELGLGEAIKMGALCRYEYRPRLVELGIAETQLYVQLSAQIAKLIAAGEDDAGTDPNSPLGSLLRRRANILGHAQGKLAVFRDDIAARAQFGFQLVYCAEGNRPSEAGEAPGPNQLEDTLRLVGRDLGIPAHRYTSETSRAERQGLLRRFGNPQDLRALVAMRCLDEGVDIPDARIGYLLASSSNPRQFIQRRGRLLRTADGKDRAEILDYLAIPSAETPLNFDVERRFLTRELERAHEFAKLSENYEETLDTLRPIKDRFQLMHI
ncbi:DEAD/DEAH box helicase family protein [Demequina rhizosphaerae]|uniref:DEAD/DEAH box helicase family protein n=1 Tax=Demequina rhizosphaerae TaxID=1638985 RepID=UPI0007819E73|nr:DEAD/DEAH box helicase family protein [Demequina rhizosphaerae]